MRIQTYLLAEQGNLILLMKKITSSYFLAMTYCFVIARVNKLSILLKLLYFLYLLEQIAASQTPRNDVLFCHSDRSGGITS